MPILEYSFNLLLWDIHTERIFSVKRFCRFDETVKCFVSVVTFFLFYIFKEAAIAFRVNYSQLFKFMN